MWWYMVPSRIAQWAPGASPLCFRGYDQEETAFHMWWMCPKARRVWIWIYNFFYSLKEINLTKSLQQVLLGYPVGGAPRPTQCLIALISTVARIMIARSWKSPVLSFNLLINMLSWIMSNKHLYHFAGQASPIWKNWDPWIAYLTGTALLALRLTS